VNAVVVSRIILASASPRRTELLKLIGLRFDVIPSDVEERFEDGDPALVAERLAASKAGNVASMVRSGIVIGADTVVVVDSRLLGKPVDDEDAKRMLAMLSGRNHEVITGVAVVDASSGRSCVEHERTRVWFRELGPSEIDAYVASGEPMDKAGAYGVQGLGSVIVRRIEGCYFNVVGLPLPRLSDMLKRFGIDVLTGFCRPAGYRV